MPDLHLLSPRGFRATGVYAGIKTKHAPDVGLLVCEGPVPAAAAVFTTNKVVAAPVVVGRRHLAQSNGRLRAVVVNAGNANACTGRQGEKDALRMCRLADVDFHDCAMREVDLYGAVLRSVLFQACDLTAATLSRASFAGCAMRDCRLDDLRGVEALGGVGIPYADLLALLPQLARAAGIDIEDDRGA